MLQPRPEGFFRFFGHEKTIRSTLNSGLENSINPTHLEDKRPGSSEWPFWGFFLVTFSGVKSDLHLGNQKVTWKKLGFDDYWWFVYSGNLGWNQQQTKTNTENNNQEELVEMASDCLGISDWIIFCIKTQNKYYSTLDTFQILHEKTPSPIPYPMIHFFLDVIFRRPNPWTLCIPRVGEFAWKPGILAIY